MSDTTSTNHNNNDNDERTNLIVASVSLAVALVALLGTFMQVMQQYYASATGFSNCSESVIGQWHKKKQRRFILRELRFEVQFDAPVILVCPADNEKFPIKRDHWWVDGRETSIKDMMTESLDASAAGNQRSSEKEVHTADNEKATWLTMLTELHRMEKDSGTWQRELYERHEVPATRREKLVKRTLCVAVQPKRRSWDTMPPNIKKPYATTTMCHLVEMAAMLGLHWREFDRTKDKYRAEGNGYVLTGCDVSDLGIMFNFQICGKCRFKENRVVPVDMVKEFVFGIVPTILRATAADGKPHDQRRLKLPSEEEQQELGYLMLGSINEVAETVASFGCNTRTADTFRDNSKKHGHLFPLAFEIVGMLSKTVYVPDTFWRMLPNPTVYHWDKRFFDLPELMFEFMRMVHDNDVVLPTAAGEISMGLVTEVQTNAKSVCAALKENKKSGEPTFSLNLCRVLYNAITWCDEQLTDRDVIKRVLREHIQAVLLIVNNEDEDENAAEERAADRGDRASIRSVRGDGNQQTATRKSRVDRLGAAPPELRHKVFMDIYFATVLPRVVRKIEQTSMRIRNDSTTWSMNPTPVSSPPASPLHSPSSSISRSPSPAPPLSVPLYVPPHQSQSEDDEKERENGKEKNKGEENVKVGDRQENPRRKVLKSSRGPVIDEVQATGIWCTLIFRMLCWLMLHDFHKNDRQVSSKSELWGSRLPVYIG